MSNFYIADLHFGHSNVIRFDNRPFKSIQEMDKTIIDNWNSRVTDKDNVYILGDFSWYGEIDTLRILDMLNGHKILIKGNHDRISPKIARKCDKICDYLEIRDEGEKVILSHYPMISWNGKFRDSVHLYGHVHNTKEWDICEKIKKELKSSQNLPIRMFNAGCMLDYMGYTPRTLAEILDAAK